MQRILIHPPFADPTQPYLSLPALKGHLRARGLDARVVDLNIEAAYHLFSPDALDDVARRIGLRFLKLNRSGSLDFHEQREYRALIEARPKIEEVLGAETSPLEVFRDKERFRDPEQYTIARRRVEAFFDALSALYFPYRFDFNSAGHDVLPWSFDLLEEYWKDSQSPLDPLYRQVFDEPAQWEPSGRAAGGIPLHDVDFLGISVVFPGQIPEAIYLSRFLKERAPSAFVALGGPCIHQIAVHLEEPSIRRLLGLADGIGLFEGEETLAQLFPLLPAWRDARTAGEKLELLARVPNLLSWDPEAGRSRRGPRHVLDLQEAALPDYSDLDLDRYLAPSRTLLYAPTRGCYWRKCSFCYYGLSEEEATARYREVPPERAAAQLARLSQRHGVRNFYISCDVLSPSYAVKLAEALLERGLKIRWSSDLKLDKYFTPERCRLLYRSGLRSAAFGAESGSDRLLALMRKGCDRATATEVNRAFHDAGVATQWMTFTDHPGETVEEALETIAWISQESPAVDLFIVGEFGLEPGSHIARNPGLYGIDKMYHVEGDDLRLHLLYTHRNGVRSRADRARVDGEIRKVGSKYALYPYPWAGAISTHHTFLHFLEFGQSVFRNHFQQAGAANKTLIEPPVSHIPGLREWARFSVDAISRQEERFLEKYLDRALSPMTLERRGIPEGRRGAFKGIAALSPADLAAAMKDVPPLRPGKR